MPASLASEALQPEKLWSVTLTGHRLACELHPVSEIAWEVHLYHDGWMLACRRFLLHTEALEFSAELRRDYRSFCSVVRPSNFWWSQMPDLSS